MDWDVDMDFTSHNQTWNAQWTETRMQSQIIPSIVASSELTVNWSSNQTSLKYEYQWLNAAGSQDTTLLFFT